MNGNSLRVLIGWKEIAAYLTCSRSTAVRRVEDGLPIFRVGGGVRAFADDIDRWLEGERIQELKGAAEPAGSPPCVVVDDTNLGETLNSLARDRNGRRFAVVSLGIDTSEFERIAGRLRSAEEKYRWVLETVPVWIWETDPRGEYTYSNVAAADILGYRPEELYGFKPAEFLLHEKDATRFRNEMSRVKKSRKVVRDFQCRFVHRDTSTIWLETDAEPVFDGAGRFAGIRGVSRDISERKRADAALLRAAEEWRRTVDATGDVILLIDREYRILRGNRAAGDCAGMSPKEIVGRRCYTLWYKRNHPCPDCHVTRMFETGEPQDRDATLPDGSLWRLRCNPVYGPSGEILGAVEVSTDITDHKRAEDALRESERKYRGVVDNSLAGFYIAQDGVVKFCNRRFAEMFGYDRVEDMDGCDIKQLVAPKSWPELDAKVALLNSGEEDSAFAEFPGIKKDGSLFYVEMLGNRIIYEGKPAVQGCVSDVTGRVRAKEALRESEMRYRTLFEESPAAIVVLDRDLNVTDVNAAATEITGIPEAASWGKPLEAILAFDNERIPGLKRVINRVLAGEDVRPFEISATRSDGETRWLNLRPAPVANGEVGSVQVIAVDITERKKAEAARERERTAFRILAEAALGAADTAALCHHVLRGFLDALAFDVGTVELFDAGRGLLYPGAVAGLPRDQIADKEKVVALDDERHISALVGRSREALFVPDVEGHRINESHGAWLAEIGIRGFIAWPLVGENDELLGVLQLGRRKPVALMEGDQVFFATVAGMFATALERRRAEEALRESEERMRAVVQNLPVLVSAFDEQGRVAMWNRECERVTGYKAEDVVGNPRALDPMYPGEGHGEKERKGFTDPTRDFRDVEIAFTAKDGSRKVISWSNPSRDLPIPGWASWAVGVDVTARRGAEEKLRRNEAFNRAIIDGSPLGISVRDRHGRLISFNRAWLDIWAAPAPEVWADMQTPRKNLRFEKRDRYLGKHQDDVRRVYEEGGYVHLPELEVRNPRENGALYVSQYFYAVLDGDGDVDRVVILTEDITERKLAEKETRQAERERVLVLANMAENVLYRNADLGVIWANDAAAALAPMPADLAGRYCNEAWYGDTPPCERCPSANLRRTDCPTEDEVGAATKSSRAKKKGKRQEYAGGTRRRVPTKCEGT